MGYLLNNPHFECKHVFFFFYPLLLHLMFLDLNDLLQALRSCSPVTAGTQAGHGHRTRGTLKLALPAIDFFVLTALFFSLCPWRHMSNKVEIKNVY